MEGGRQGRREGGIAKGCGVLKLDTGVVAHLSKCTEEMQTFKRGLCYYSSVRLFGNKEMARQNKEQISPNEARGFKVTFSPSLLPFYYRTSLAIVKRKIKERLTTESSSQC